jgi:hypothetical protein
MRASLCSNVFKLNISAPTASSSVPVIAAPAVPSGLSFLWTIVISCPLEVAALRQEIAQLKMGLNVVAVVIMLT